ncbi:MAG: ParB/RepB/Spo0J family partition protein [Microgenomates group bacterium]
MTDHKDIHELDIDMVQPNPTQPRGTILPNSVADLVESIKEHGILEPLVIAHTPAGYQIIAGERRWRASKIIGLKRVPVVIKETTPKGMLEMAIVENVQRTDLNPIERGKAFIRLMREFNLSNADIAKKVSKSPAYVSNTLKLLDLPDALTDGLIGGLITEGHARALASIEDTRTMIEAYKLVLKEGASVRRTEEIARRLRKASGGKPQNGGRPAFILSDEITAMQARLNKALGERSMVKMTRSRKETKIMIKLLGSPDETDKTLAKILKLAE